MISRPRLRARGPVIGAALVVALCVTLPLRGQDSSSADNDQSSQSTHSAQGSPTDQQQIVVPPSVVNQPPSATSKPDALLLYRQGRDLESAGKTADAQAKYTQSVAICSQELAQDPKRMEAYVVKCWSLFRLGRHDEVISNGLAALKIQFDPRVSEVMGESFYFLGQMDSSLKYLQRYVDAVGEDGDRFSTAYFFMGEAYLRLKKYSHADMAYSTAVSKDPSMSRWWYRLGMACEYLEDWKRAYQAYSKAVSLSPGYQDALDGQGRVKPKAGL
ncbi:MAG TPA: tetratricopeptide repeat protein [Rectinemataceae bacterium]|nr:tetratricopeptide repeat protein [Rectinemataceae bacterium]